jgi:hypothetical protein
MGCNMLMAQTPDQFQKCILADRVILPSANEYKFPLTRQFFQNSDGAVGKWHPVVTLFLHAGSGNNLKPLFQIDLTPPRIFHLDGMASSQNHELHRLRTDAAL